MDRSDAFVQIYRNRLWGSGASRSGLGSEPAVARPYVEYVKATLSAQRVESVVDIGHGDWVMWPEDAFDGLDYMGFDIVPGLSEEVREQHGNQHRTFALGDAVVMQYPHADAVLCKDVLQHLSNSDVDAVLQKVRAFSLVIICHDLEVGPTKLRGHLRRMRQRMAPLSRLRCALGGKNFFGTWSRRQNPESGASSGDHAQVIMPNHDIQSGGYRCLDIETPPWNPAAYGMQVIERVDFPISLGPWTRVTKRIWLLIPQERGSDPLLSDTES